MDPTTRVLQHQPNTREIRRSQISWAPGDRHVLAAAIRASAQVIVTENRRDFPAAVLEEYGIETLGADDMLVSTYELFPSEAAQALSRGSRRYRSDVS
jgi:hypothetical protein